MKSEDSHQVYLPRYDEESLRLLGKIQSHGYLLAFCKKTNLLSYYSENCRSFLDNLPTPVEKIHLNSLACASLVDFCREIQDDAYQNQIFGESVEIPINGTSREYKFHVSNTSENIILEFEELSKAASAGNHSNISWLNKAIDSLKITDSISDLAAQASFNFRKFSGFDRVMIYRYHENSEIEVIGEDKEFGLDSYLGIRYPASDIHAESLKLYETNIVRAIYDVEDAGIPICSTENVGGALNQSHSVYRIVSPTHIQYLKNMGVRATYANSIMVNNRLWGMLICHHYNEPKYLGLTKHLFSLLYTTSIAKWIETNEINMKRERSVKENELLDILGMNSRNRDLYSLLKSNWEKICDILKIDAFSITLRNLSKAQYPVNIKLPSQKMIFEEFHKEKRGPVQILKNKKPESEIASLAVFQIFPPAGATIYFYRIEKNKILSSETSIPWSDRDLQFLEKMSEILRDPNPTLKPAPKRDGLRKSKADLLSKKNDSETSNLMSNEKNQLQRENLLLLQQLEIIRTELINLKTVLNDSQKITLTQADLSDKLPIDMRSPHSDLFSFTQTLQSDESPELK
jgi:hypothetical protein